MIRLRCSVNPKHQNLLSNFVGRVTGAGGTPPESADGILTNEPAVLQAFRDLSGAINVGVPFEDAGDGVPVAHRGSLSGAPLDFTYTPGVVDAFDATISGNASASVNEGGQGLYGGVFDAMPTSVMPGQFTTWGAKAIYGLPIKTGQFLLVFSQAPVALAGRADVRSA